MSAGLFSATALTLTLPTGAGGGSVLLICSIVYLAVRRRQPGPHPAGRRELLFLGSMTLYPLAVALNCLVSVEPIQWRYFDNPSRFLLALPVYWAIRKSRAMPDALVMGAITGASIAGVLALCQWVFLGHERSSGFSNALPFAHITLLLVCIAMIPIPLSGPWPRLRIFGVASGVVAIFFSQTLGAWVAIPILALLMMKWILVHYEMDKRWGVAIVAVLAGLLLLVLEMKVMPMVHVEAPRQETVGSERGGRLFSTVPAQVACRIELWRAGWTFFSRHPWFGIGFGRYQTEAKALQEKGTISFIGCIRGRYETLTHAHSDFVQIGATLGGPAILAYLLPLILLYCMGRYCCRRNDHEMGIILKVYAAGHGIFSLTQTQLNHNISTTFFAFTAVSLAALAANRLEAEGRPRTGSAS